MDLNTIQTPALLLDLNKFTENCEFMKINAAVLACSFGRI